MLITTVLFVFFGTEKKKYKTDLQKNKIFNNAAKFQSEGGGVEYIGYNKNNEESIRIKCIKSEMTKNNKIFMKKVVAVFVPKSRVKNEVTISGDNGIVENNLHDFILTGNSKIRTKDFVISSSLLKLKNSDRVTSNKLLKYKTKNLNGEAKSMAIRIRARLLSFFDTVGLYKTKDKIVKYKTDRLYLNDNTQMASFKKLKKTNIIWGEDFSITGDRILTKFTEDYKKEVYTAVRHKCEFIMTKKNPSDPENIKNRNIKAKYINLNYTESGNISSVDARHHTEVELKSNTYQINISTNVFNMDFYEEKQTIKSISLESINNEFFYKDFKNEKEEYFQLTGREINLLYNENGEIAEWEVIDNKSSQFLSKKYLCIGSIIKYKLIGTSVLIRKNAKVEIDKENTFKSEELLINTEKRTLSSSKPVSATIQLKQKSVLLSTNPIYVKSNSMKMDELKSFMEFKGKVFLMQNDVAIETDKLIISEKKGIKCKSSSEKKSVITFLNNNKEVVLEGEEIEFLREERLIKIIGKAGLKDDDNKINGNILTIYFNKEGIEKIKGIGDILFKKDKLIIESNTVEWLYDKELAIFEELKKVEKKEIGSIKGKQIKLNLKTNIITVFSEADERTETILE